MGGEDVGCADASSRNLMRRLVVPATAAAFSTSNDNMTKFVLRLGAIMVAVSLITFAALVGAYELLS